MDAIIRKYIKHGNILNILTPWANFVSVMQKWFTVIKILQVKYTLSMTKEVYFIINGCQRHWYSVESLNLNGKF